MTDKDLVYVLLTDQQALICKAIMPVPSGMSVAVKVFPCVTKVRPHTEYEELFVVPIPLNHHMPYTPQAIHGKQVHNRPLFFRLGYFVGTKFTESAEKQIKTSDGAAIRFDAFTYSNQKLLTVGPLAEAVPVFELK